VAVAYAARHPDRVSRLVLYGGYVQGAVARARTPEELEEATMLMRNLPLGWGRDNPAFRLFFAAKFIPEGTAEQLRWFSDLQRITTTPEIAVRLRSTAAAIDVTMLAPQVRAPTIVLHATGDGAVPFDQGRSFAALIPGARFVPLESRNHIILPNEPAWPRFCDEVRRFLAEDATDTRPPVSATVGASVKGAASSPPQRSTPRPRSDRR
jgi:pimeloyl-ACP methyl ester carboxylesterase